MANYFAPMSFNWSAHQMAEMNRTRTSTLRRHYYRQSHDQLQQHPVDFALA